MVDSLISLLLYSLLHKCLIFYLPLKCDSFLVFYYKLFSPCYSHPSWVIPSMPLDSTTMILSSILSMIMSTIPTSPAQISFLSSRLHTKHVCKTAIKPASISSRISPLILAISLNCTSPSQLPKQETRESSLNKLVPLPTTN